MNRIAVEFKRPPSIRATARSYFQSGTDAELKGTHFDS